MIAALIDDRKRMVADAEGGTSQRRTGTVLLAVITALVVAVTARAEYDPPITTLVTNTLQFSGSDRNITLCENQDGLYQGFRTGPKQGGYELTDISLHVRDANEGRYRTINAGLYHRAYKTEIISTPWKRDPNKIDGYTYRYGENIDVALTFNTDVYVPEDDSWVVIRIGDAANGSNSRVAEYLSGSDTNRLIYRYQVEFDDADANGISIDEGGLDAGFVGWVPTIVASSGLLPVERYFPGVADDPIHKVDGSLRAAVGMDLRRGNGGPVRTTVANDTRPNDKKRIYP